MEILRKALSLDNYEIDKIKSNILNKYKGDKHEQTF